MGLNIIVLDKNEELKDLLINEKTISTTQFWKDCDSFQKQLKTKPFDVALINPNCCNLEIDVLIKFLAYQKIPSLIILERYDDVEKTIDALSAGAFDYFQKPFIKIMPKEDVEKIKNDILTKIDLAQKNKDKLKVVIPGEKEELDYEFTKSTTKKIIIIGSSTGGPQSLDQIVPIFPKNTPSPIIIVQHMPQAFTQKFAERLNSISEMKVKEAEDEEEIKEGTCYIAKGDYHLEIKKNKDKAVISLNQKERMLGVRPNINMTMESAAKVYGKRTVGVILTGMGSDGTIGAKKIKEKGGTIIAQSTQTSIISSMPKSVIESGYCDEIVDLNKIPVAILQLLEV